MVCHFRCSHTQEEHPGNCVLSSMTFTQWSKSLLHHGSCHYTWSTSASLSTCLSPNPPTLKATVVHTHLSVRAPHSTTNQTPLLTENLGIGNNKKKTSVAVICISLWEKGNGVRNVSKQNKIIFFNSICTKP